MLIETAKDISSYIKTLGEISPFVKRRVDFGTLAYLRGERQYLVDGLPDPYEGLRKRITGEFSGPHNLKDPVTREKLTKLLESRGYDSEAANLQREGHELQKNLPLPYVDELQQYVATSTVRMSDIHPVVASEVKTQYSFPLIAKTKLPNPARFGSLEEFELGLLSSALNQGNLSCSEVSLVTQLLYQDVRDIYRVQGFVSFGETENHAFNVLLRNGTLFLVDIANPIRDDEVFIPFVASIRQIDKSTGVLSFAQEQTEQRMYQLPTRMD